MQAMTVQAAANGQYAGLRAEELLYFKAADYSTCFGFDEQPATLLRSQTMALPVKVKNTFIEGYAAEEDSDDELPMVAVKSCPVVQLQAPPRPANAPGGDSNLASVLEDMPEDMPEDSSPQSVSMLRTEDFLCFDGEDYGTNTSLESAPAYAKQVGEQVSVPRLKAVKVKNTFIDGFDIDEDSEDELPMLAVKSCPVVQLPTPQWPSGGDGLASVLEHPAEQRPVPRSISLGGPQSQPMGPGGGIATPAGPVNAAWGKAPQPGHLAAPEPPVQTPPQPAAQHQQPQRAAQPAAPGVVPLERRQLQMSVGAVLHGSGQCRPCAWYWRPQGCANGEECRHCHLCPAGEVKARRKSKIASLRTQSRAVEQSVAVPATRCALELTKLV